MSFTRQFSFILLCSILLIEMRDIKGSKTADPYSEQDLGNYINTLIESHNTDVRPVLHRNDTVIVEMSAILASIISLDEVSEQVSVCAKILMRWHNPFLVWNDTNYPDSISIPCSKIWVPQLFMESVYVSKMNSCPKVSVELHPDNPICHVDWHGTVHITIIQVVTSTCQLEIFAYPFDKQTCHLDYSLLGYKNDHARLEPLTVWESLPLRDHAKPQHLPEWHVTNYRTFLIEVPNAQGMPAREIRHSLTLERKSLHSIVNVVIPTYVIFTLSMIGVFSPSDGTGEIRNEKISVGLTCLLTMSVLLLTVSDITPKTNEGCLLGHYLLLEFVLSTIATVLATKLVYINTHLAKESLPRYISCLPHIPKDESQAEAKLEHEKEFHKLRDMILLASQPTSTRFWSSTDEMSRFKLESLKIAHVYKENVVAMLLDQCLKHLLYIRKMKEELETDSATYSQRMKWLARLEFIMLLFFLILNTIITLIWFVIGITYYW